MLVRLLGSPAIVDGNESVCFGGRKERVVFTVLALNAGSVVSEGRLIDAIWPEGPPRTARKTLQNYVLRLRKVLPGGDAHRPGVTIETRPPGYMLASPPLTVDVQIVEDLFARARIALADGQHALAVDLLSQGLAYWQGRPLEEFADQPFAIGEIARLDELRLSMREHRIEARLTVGQHEECAAELEPLVAAYPMREQLWRQMMLALYRSNRQAESLRAYQRARRTLIEELGVEPGPDLRRLEQAIIMQDPSLDASPRISRSQGSPGTGRRHAGQAGWTVAIPLPSPLAVRDRGALVGRESERVRLSDAWSRAGAGERRALFIGGEPGIGKTRLAAELAADTHGRAIILYGRCDEELRIAHQPFAEALRYLHARVPEADLG
ncbi:MAG: AAA family ATPase, partial [Candidatus Dormibacteraeota bacterium]|nr:AAA family ATPase [Candidatus Dormibacteraeota bacterium]